MQKQKSLSLAGKGQTAAVRRCPRFFRDRKRQSDHFAAAGYPTRRPKAAHGNERCGGFAPPSPALCATAKSGGRNSSRVIIVSDIIPCPRQIVNRAALFCGGWARSALGGCAALLSAALFFAETLPLGGGASRRRRAALFLAKGSSTPRRVRRAAPSRHTRRPFAAAARACRARRSFPLPAR